MKMHEGEVPIDRRLVTRLIGEQFPHLAALPLRAARSIGTVNAIYRLGDELCVRLPRLQKWVGGLERELAWLPVLARSLSLRVPAPAAIGRPSNDYPFPWAIYSWIAGDPYEERVAPDEIRAAEDLAAFVTELRRIDPAGAPRGGRKPLRDLDVVTRAAIDVTRGVVDAGRAAAAWARALEVPPWDGAAPVWIHADLLRPNLLVERGRLGAVLDFGAAGVGDPAADVIAAWSVFGRAGRSVFRRILDVDDDTWSRARGYALHQALQIIPYYSTTNPEFVMLARRTIEEILADEA
jgi:aminoglycoside phosphotransferase (APT) family kinase protein